MAKNEKEKVPVVPEFDVSCNGESALVKTFDGAWHAALFANNLTGADASVRFTKFVRVRN